MVAAENFFDRPVSFEIEHKKHMSVKEKIQQIEARTPRGGRGKNNFQGIRNQTRTFHPKIANSNNANFNANKELMIRTAEKAEELTIDNIEKHTPPEDLATKNIFDILSSKADEIKSDSDLQAEISKEAERQKERELFNLPTPKRVSGRSQTSKHSSASSKAVSTVKSETSVSSKTIPERVPLNLSINIPAAEVAVPEEVSMVHDENAGVRLEVSTNHPDVVEIIVDDDAKEKNEGSSGRDGDDSTLSSYRINSVNIGGSPVNVVKLVEDDDNDNGLANARKSTATVSTQSTFSSRSSLSTASQIVGSSVGDKRQPLRFNNDIEVIELQSTTTGTATTEVKTMKSKKSFWRLFVCGL